MKYKNKNNIIIIFYKFFFCTSTTINNYKLDIYIPTLINEKDINTTGKRQKETKSHLHWNNSYSN